MDAIVNTKPKAGVIGLGAMGYQMARHLKEKGFTVSGYDVSAEATTKSEAIGIPTRTDIAAVGSTSNVVIVMVQTDKQVVEVIREGGLLASLAPGSVICIASSIAPVTCRQLESEAAEKGVGVLDTPVVLGQEAADNGTLTVFAGGEANWLEAARPVLSAFSGNILHIGPSGTGQIAKTANNMLLWACICANFEALSLARELGANVPTLVSALMHSSGANWSLSRWGKSTGKWAEKDMDVALDLAQSVKLPLPLNGLVDQLMKSMNKERMQSLLN
ncbi:NAD(P)-dependent oxidoreductase (plasmid) [Ensifer adhaerens]|uniref:NAD(P)-dependent oxidoreductase n=1 Tax=Ensifer adhaerens TaxID=106592 RepID=UPI001CBD8DEB|nr:NAD(P)-dependent oxidoreductase [Ensifer adhaerens]MBZ7927363.1 NAD(P)-dependent oxidoreductase [Ensifer adhaerens]UAX98370.1 NAD(P)-dependent oxidoreductase [Ensifer adhaerens]UAY05753.1 NAD(P)-dependent oxidoreductase [Ensifer adhaerens]UAY13131.1 NAD(P)-dependent oxidoreductase [Ensifer adhaerens]